MQHRFDKHLKGILYDNIECSDVSVAYNETGAESGSGRSFKIIAGVSGGADSICMLELLCCSSLNIDVCVAHMNFNLRGGESDGDELFVREQAELRGLAFFSKSVDTLAYAKRNSISIEMAARELRYNWFYELIQSEKADLLAIAHNANDNAETLLLNLVRGTGYRGICGISEFSKFSLMGKSVELHNFPQHELKSFAVVRPLLIFRRDEIESFLDSKNLSFRIDKTNFDIDFSRNRIRNSVLPSLSKINPSVIETLNKDIYHFKQANIVLDYFISELKNKFVVYGPSVFSGKRRSFLMYLLDSVYLLCTIDIEAVCDYVRNGDGLGGNAIGFLLLSFLERYGFNSDACDKMLDSSGKPFRARRFYSDGHVAVVERGKIKVYCADVESLPESSIVEDCGGEQSIRFGAIDIVISDHSLGDRVHDELRIAADDISLPIAVRPVSDGDRFVPFGLHGSKLVNDYLSDKKVDNVYKSLCPVIADSGGNIVSLPGLEISDGFKVRCDTDKILYLSVLINK